MRYDKMIEVCHEQSVRKMKIAKKEIEKMLESNEKITVTALVRKTGFSKGFFYRNDEMRRLVNEAMHQQSVTYNPKQVIIYMAMEERLLNTKIAVQKLKAQIRDLEKRNEELQHELEEVKKENAKLKNKN